MSASVTPNSIGWPAVPATRLKIDLSWMNAKSLRGVSPGMLTKRAMSSPKKNWSMPTTDIAAAPTTSAWRTRSTLSLRVRPSAAISATPAHATMSSIARSAELVSRADRAEKLPAQLLSRSVAAKKAIAQWTGRAATRCPE